MKKNYTTKKFRILVFLLLSILNVVFANSLFANATYIDKDVKGIAIKPSSSANKTFQLFSHGRSGELLIDGKWLDSPQIASFVKSEIKNQKSTIKNLNIYGCEFAKGFKGLQAVAYLESALGVSVSASTNITGKNGDWILEVGKAEEVIVLNNYEGSLQATSCGGVIGGILPLL